MARIARLITLFAFALMPVVPAFAAEPDPPTATFVGKGAPPVSCGSRPDVRSQTLPADARLLVINETDVDAIVVVDNDNVLNVPDSSGALLTLSPGVHVITMVPACLHHSAIKELTVTVTAGAGPAAATPADVPSTDTARAGEPSAAAASMGAPYPETATTGAQTAAAIDPSRPSVSASVGPSATNLSNLDVGWRGVDATLVDLGRSESQLPGLVTVGVVIFLLGMTVATAPAFGWLKRRMMASRHRRGQLSSDTLQQSDQDHGAADDLRDRLRELVQAAHLGADPGKVEAARAELFAQNPRPDEHAET
jgi:hypothetical protein